MILLVGSTDRWRLRMASLTWPYLTSANEHWRAAVIGRAGGKGRVYSIKLPFEIETENKSRPSISTDIYHLDTAPSKLAKKGVFFRKQRCVPTIIGVSGRRLSKWLSRDLIRLRGRGGWRLLRRVWNSNANRLWGTPPQPVPHSPRQRTAGHLRPQRPAAQQDKTVGRTELPRRDQTCRIVRLRPSIGS
jgi:hypothetical protein